MLEYLYTDDYDDNGEAASLAHYAHGKGASANLQATTVTEEEQLCAHDPPDYSKTLNNIAVYAIADKYDIPALQVLAAEKFKQALWNDRRVLKDLASLPAIIDAVFDTTPDTQVGVRKEANKYWDRWDEEDAQVGIRKQATKYCKYWHEYIIDNEDAITIVRDHGEIGKAMIRSMFREHDEHERSMKAKIEAAMGDANTLLSDIENISRAAKYMKVSDVREVKETDIDARHRRIKDLRDAIQEAKDCLNEDSPDGLNEDSPDGLNEDSPDGLNEDSPDIAVTN